MVEQCKCHGLAGSCAVKTCWRAMPSFQLIGAKLKEKYDAATQVEVRRRHHKHRIVPRNQLFRRLSAVDLIFLKPSPDWCVARARLAARGTRGRVCNRNSRGIDGCELLCCGRPYRTQLQTVKFKCSCKFVWCCSVQCKECQTVREVSRCT